MEHNQVKRKAQGSSQRNKERRTQTKKGEEGKGRNDIPMTENEFLLQDRLNVIRDTINKYGEENFYLSFSGGKDSTVVHHLLDMTLPDNKIPRVFINTGIEYNDIVSFVKELAKEDGRFTIINPTQNIKQMLERVGYPFKSKEHSVMVNEWQLGHRNTKKMKSYLADTRSKYECPKILRYQFTDDFNLKVSAKCCMELKKKPVKKWQKENNRPINITGMQREEGGERTHIDCIMIKNGKLVKFHPLAKVTGEWEDWYIRTNNIRLCKLYYEPYSFFRTGCKGCPFSLSLSTVRGNAEIYA